MLCTLSAASLDERVDGTIIGRDGQGGDGVFTYESSVEVDATPADVALALQLTMPPSVLEVVDTTTAQYFGHAGFGQIHGMISFTPDRDRLAHDVTRLDIAMSLDWAPGMEGHLKSVSEAISATPEEAERRFTSAMSNMGSDFEESTRNLFDTVRVLAVTIARTGCAPVSTKDHRLVTMSGSTVRAMLESRLRVVPDGESLVASSLTKDGWLSHRFTMSDRGLACFLTVESTLDVPVAAHSIEEIGTAARQLSTASSANLDRLVQEITKRVPMLSAGPSAAGSTATPPPRPDASL